MKRIFFLFFAIMVCGAIVSTILLPIHSHAETTPTPINLNTPFPGQNTSIPGGENAFNTYIAYLYRFALILGTFFAMLMIVVGAITYTTSAGNASRQHDAKDRIMNALYGLILLISVVLVLNFLNPALLTSRSPSLSGPGKPIDPSNPFAGGGAPTNLTIERLSSGELKLGWEDNSSDEDHFEIEYANTTNSNANWYPISRNVASDSTTYTFGQNANYYRVVAVSKSGEKSPSEPKASPGYAVGSNIAAPSIFGVSRPDPVNSPDLVRVSWVDNSANEEQFLIEGFKPGVDTGITPITGTGSTGGPSVSTQGTWENIGAYGPVRPDGVLYNQGQGEFSSEPGYTQVRIIAQGTVNGQAVFSLSAPASIPSSVQSTLGAPSNLSYTFGTAPVFGSSNATDPVIFLSWQDNSTDETGFTVKRCASSNAGTANCTGISAVSRNQTTATLDYGTLNAAFNSSAYPPGTVATILVVAIGPNGTTAESGSISFQIPPFAGATGPTFAIPAAGSAPGGLAIAPAGGGLINLTWSDNSSNEDQFLIQYRTPGATNWQGFGTAQRNATQKQLDPSSLSLPSGQYELRVIAFVNATTRSDSGSITFTVP